MNRTIDNSLRNGWIHPRIRRTREANPNWHDWWWVLIFTVGSFIFQVNGSWSLPGFVCDFYIAMDVTCSTSSIFNLVAISIDRWASHFQKKKKKKRRKKKKREERLIPFFEIHSRSFCQSYLPINTLPWYIVQPKGGAKRDTQKIRGSNRFTNVSYDVDGRKWWTEERT